MFIFGAVLQSQEESVHAHDLVFPKNETASRQHPDTMETGTCILSSHKHDSDFCDVKCAF